MGQSNDIICCQKLSGYRGWMWTGNIAHKGDIWTMELNEWKNFHSKNIIYVSLRIISNKQVMLPPIIPPQTKTETPPKWSRSMTHALAKRSTRRW